MDTFLGRDHVEVSVYRDAGITLYCKFSDALLRVTQEQWDRMDAFVREARIELDKDAEAQRNEPVAFNDWVAVLAEGGADFSVVKAEDQTVKSSRG